MESRATMYGDRSIRSEGTDCTAASERLQLSVLIQRRAAIPNRADFTKEDTRRYRSDMLKVLKLARVRGQSWPGQGGSLGYRNGASAPEKPQEASLPWKNRT